ncbi:MAG: hypothetical protein EU530_03465 [Promethearchaeota archaeon]|nr:MAG: hypothetical protein EU530_03465 [Candidatus Lokiarchaeota archaeon]
MRIRKHKPRKWVQIIKVCVVTLPIILVSLFAVDVKRKFNDLAAFTQEYEPDPSSFINGNYTRFAEMAEYYDSRFEEFHMPLNMSTDTVFTDNSCTTVDYYQYSDNTGQWTGLAITAWVYKYLTAIRENDLSMKTDSLRVIRKLFHGMSMQLAVPNGGLGSEYGGILARGWADPALRNISEFYFQDTNLNNDDRYTQHHNGTGPYSNFRWRGYTSLDEYSGFLGGLSFVYKYVQEPDIQATAKLMIDQVAHNFLETSWLGIDWHGGLTGVSMKVRFFQSGAWAALVLKLGALAFPEKYNQIYYHYVVEELFGQWATMGSQIEVVANYYAFAFSYHVCFALLMLETDPQLRTLYYKEFDESIFSFTDNHRNPFYNMILLILNDLPGENPILERDVEDQLMRYDCEYHFPDRRLGHKNSSLDSSYVPVVAINELNDFLDNNWLGWLYRPFYFEIERDDVFFSKPQTVEFMPGDIFIWEENPFEDYTDELGDINARYEYAGFSFTIVYWMARGAGYFPASGVRSTGVEI